jgi:uncharacterized membrane protein
MNKTRLEALSDGVFAIVMTLLIIEIHVPELEIVSGGALLSAMQKLAPLFVSYFVSFAVLATFWVGHNFFYGAFTKNINRQLVQLNMLYLALIALIPFSSHLLGTYTELPTAVRLYGLNVFAIGFVSALVLFYALRSEEIDTSHVTKRLLKQAKIRSVITPILTLLGIGVSYISIPGAIFLYAFPIIFNIIPGTLDFTERLFGFSLD